MRKDPCALELFQRLSGLNQFLTFLQTAPFHSRTKVVRVGEYILIETKTGEGGIFVIGLDENYNFFCHRLPEGIMVDTQDISEREIRRLMGFDFHSWEMRRRNYYPGVRVRLQGDIVVSFIETFMNDVEFFLYTAIRMVIPSMYIDWNDRLYRHARDLIKILARRGYYDTELLGELLDRLMRYRYGKNGLRKLEERILKIVDRLVSDERIYRIRIGNHIVKLIGTHLDPMEYRLVDTTPERDLWLMSNRIFVVLRPHVITAYHDEHRTTSMWVPISIIEIDTLRSSIYQVRRDNIEAPIEQPTTLLDRFFSIGETLFLDGDDNG